MNTANVVSSQTAESIFRREARSGMWTIADDLGLDVYVFEHDGQWSVDTGEKARHEAPAFATIADALQAFPKLRAYCEREAAKPTWQDYLRADLKRAAEKCGCDVSALQFEHATLDRCWGDLVGLVFWGASDECNKRAAEFFARWADKNRERFNLCGGYSRQQAIRYEGVRHYARFSNGAEGWYRTAVELRDGLVETRVGHAAAYVYYPCAE
jgi:hypothetical protein